MMQELLMSEKFNADLIAELECAIRIDQFVTIVITIKIQLDSLHL